MQAQVHRMLGAPGFRFDYGPSHLSVAAAMAETQTSLSWDKLFENLRTSLEIIRPLLRFVRLPKQETGGEKPLVAGGMLSTTEEYLPLLSFLFHRGEANGTQLIAADKVDRFIQNLYENALVGDSPFSDVS
ncbi:MAG: hypothetical protein GY822_06695 [Deltaproteobacteria bacterium]|nr:hypothetical protein [Deltaproteobacteria bacterium]